MKSTDRFIPLYARRPLVAMLLWDLVVYCGSRLFTAGLSHYDFTTGLDQIIPFLPVFIIPYVLAYAQWVIGYISITRESTIHCYMIASTEILAEVFALILYILVPTTLVRPEIQGTDLFSRAVAFLYLIDTPDNLLPSIHCLESWLVLRGTLTLKHVSRSYKAGMTVLTILVLMSTVFIKQHLLIDIISAIVIVELSLSLCKMYFAHHPIE